MRLHILSDLHLEFAELTPPQTDADVVILAGDIHVGREGRAWTRHHFPDRPVVYVLGNHEFYREAIPELTTVLQGENDGAHIHLLENSAAEIDGVTFLGCTLWTDFRLNCDESIARQVAEETMSDYGQILVSPEYRKLRASDTARFHAASVAWLRNELPRHDPTRTVVVTHHAPCPQSVPPEHEGNLLNGAFVSDLETLIESSRVPLWIHGHTHYNVDYRVGATRVLSNQRGYPGDPVKWFDPSRVVDV